MALPVARKVVIFGDSTTDEMANIFRNVRNDPLMQIVLGDLENVRHF